jgi:hypothetical protein
MYCVKCQRSLARVTDNPALNVFLIKDFLKRIIRTCSCRQDYRIGGDFFHFIVNFYLDTGRGDFQSFGR